MAIERDEDNMELEFTCDANGCKKAHGPHPQETPWGELMNDLKDDGWRKSLINGTWRHFCKIH